MSKALQVAVLSVLASGLTGCTGGRSYFVNRGRDAVDVVSLTAGYGLGARLRAGPVEAAFPLEGRYHLVGIQGGEAFKSNRKLSGVSALFWWRQNEEGRKTFSAEGWRGTPVGLARHKDLTVDSHMPLFITEISPKDNIAYWFALEASGGFLASLRVGVNPGELLDFILGWTTVDIFDDDCEKQPGEQ